MAGSLKYATIETELGWVGVALSEGGLRAVELPLPGRTEAIERMSDLGADEPASDADLGAIPAAVRALVAGRSASNGVRLDWTGITPSY